MIDPNRMQVGTKVVCKADAEPFVRVQLKQRTPVAGLIYTVRERFRNWEGTTVFRLEEIKNEPRDWGKDGHSEIAFPFYIFEPVEDFKKLPEHFKDFKPKMDKF